MSRAYEKAIMNDEGNEDDCNGEISWGIVHKKWALGIRSI